jgi:tetratricopeptide (TPR) repeat protein
VLVNSKKTLLPLALAAAVTFLGVRQPAFAQAAQAQTAQKNWKDRAEFDLYDAITKEQQPAKRLELLNQWKEKYPSSEFSDTRLQVYVVTYQQLGKPAETIATANELLAKDPNNVTALNAILTAVFTIPPPPSADQLASAEKAANQVLSNIDTLFAVDKKPQGVTDAAWNQAKEGVRLLAQNALGYIAWQRKDYGKAETEFTKSLQLNPNQGQISYWLGTVVLAQKDPAKQSAALWDFARAASLEGQGAFPARDAARKFLDNAYRTYHGSTEGLDQLMAQAKTQALPPANFKVPSKVDIERTKLEEEQKAAAANPMLALWKNIKAELTGPNGAQYFETSMKGAALPGGANGVQKFTGKLVDSKPDSRPKELVLAIEDGKTPDVTLKLDTPLAGKMEPGAEIGFEGVATSYTATPFMVTFDVEKSKITGWKGAPAPAPRKAAPRRPVSRKK